MSNIPDVTNIEKVQDLYQNSVEMIEQRLKRGIDLPVNFIPTVNKKMNGFSRGELVVVGARPSNGKSIFCINLALDIAKAGKKVHFCSLEMTKQSCGDRILSNLTSIDGLKVLSGDLTGEKNAHARITDGYNKLVDANLTFSDAIGFNWQEIDYLVDNMKGIDILIIDYIQMVAGQGQLRKEAIDDYIKKLRAVAVRKNICIVIASQINRGGADGTMPQMKDLKSTGCLEEIADKVILLHYNYFYTKEQEEYNQYEVLLEKNRQGMTMAKKCVIYPELCQIGECYEPSTFKRSN